MADLAINDLTFLPSVDNLINHPNRFYSLFQWVFKLKAIQKLYFDLKKVAIHIQKIYFSISPKKKLGLRKISTVCQIR